MASNTFHSTDEVLDLLDLETDDNHELDNLFFPSSNDKIVQKEETVRVTWREKIIAVM